ncbi:MAG: hypothetical protein R3Y29_01265 [bacterium]
MKKYNNATGLITTGLVGMGIAYALTDKKTKNRLMHDGKKMLNKAEQLADKMDIF